jgi:hypothetical protein
MGTPTKKPVSTNDLFAKNASNNYFIGILVACLAFIVPLGLMYSLFFHRKTSWFRVPVLFITVVSLGYIANLMFYRMAVMNDADAKIDKLSGNDAAFIFYNTLAGFFIVAITLFAISVTPVLVTIFENTFGYWFVNLWGATKLCNEIFISKSLENLSDIDPSEFNYSFLITRIDHNNVEEFIDYAKQCDGGTISNLEKPDKRLPLDFYMKFEFEDQVEKLRNLVYLKNTFGHFMWTYLSSIVALFASMIALLMASS